MIRRPPRSTPKPSSAASDVYKRQAVLDQLGFCMFVGPEARNLPVFRDFVNARYGWNVTEDDLLEMGRSLLRLETDFNRKAGIDEHSNQLPPWFRTEPLEPSGRTFDVDEDRLRKMKF